MLVSDNEASRLICRTIFLFLTRFLPIFSVDELQGLFNVIKSEITARTVAKTLGMMIQTPKNSNDTVVREIVDFIQ